ncbi:MAG: aspartyl protease family protein [Acetobacteraceae bacterium]|nr:aspartyl protease family protein [Acetobacteraceae bacterium]MBV8524191.1 aspartyl protease family protein [Acetobacteraceae bacterium]MBV8590719.1 aspartyl protease family protein [Acetobacteraceae bacterium]
MSLIAAFVAVCDTISAMRRLVPRFLLLFASIAHGHGACRIERKTEVPVRIVQNYALVELAVNGRTATFLLDTGAERTVFANTAIEELGLARDEWVSSSIRGMGGVIERTANVVLRSFDIGGLPLRRRSVNPVLSFAVAPLPWHEIGGRTISGVLGADYLSVFDLDLDLPGGKLTLYDTIGCMREQIPWEPANSPVLLEHPKPYVILAPVQILGRTLHAQLDTGASFSFVSWKGAAQLSITPTMLAQTPELSARGIGRQGVAMRSRSFELLRLGPVEYHDVRMLFGSPAGGFPFEMLLGMDLLRSQHIFISYATNRLLIATNAKAD